MKEKNNQTKLFDQPDIKAKRSTFDLSYPNKMTLNFNKLIPTCCKKTMPGDSWHVNTSVFSRWLSMQAPTFSEYSIKFLNCYVPNNLLWGGWQQFAGEGDAQASQYLLPGVLTGLQNNQVPNFTTRDLTVWFARKIFNYGFQYDYQGAGLPFPTPSLNSFSSRFFRLFIAPVICRKFDNSVHLDSLTNNIDDNTFFVNGGKFYTRNILVCGSTLDNNFWDEMVNKGYCVEIPLLSSASSENTALAGEINEFTSTSASWDFAFYCNSYNVTEIADFATSADKRADLIELPKHTFFPCTLQDFSVDSSTDFLVPENQLRTAWEQAYKSRFVPRCPAISSGQGLNNMHYEADYYFPAGYIYSLAPSEAGLSRFSAQDIFERTFGQHIILQLMGAGSLTDYLGKCYSQSLIRQPLETANACLGYFGKGTIVGSWNKPNATIATTVKGTYNENSVKFDIGVVNDVRVSFLPYLAYHKIWTDYIRDPRYELRFFYSDPYRSPFLQPLYGQGNNLRNGTYMQGSVLTNNTLDTYDPCAGVMKWGVVELNNTEYYIGQSVVQSKITPSAPFSLDGIVQLLSLQKRRVVHDFFTMVTPTQQYGLESVTQVSNNEVSTLALRMATRLQKFLERSNFAGSDFVKQTLAHFGVKPEHCQHCSVKYLGGKKMTPTISPVTVTSTDNSDSNQVTGQQSAQMYCSGNLGKVNFETDQHGYFLQLCCVQNDFFTTDGQEVDPITYLDYPNPIFGDLGPEPLPLTRVVSTDGTNVREGNNTNPLSVFGYIPRYAQWKCSLAEIHGDFRKSLSYWVSKRQFDPDLLNGSFGYGKRGNTPRIGKSFLYENADYNAFTYTGEEFDHALLDIDHQITVSRELPMLPTPSVL